MSASVYGPMNSAQMPGGPGGGGGGVHPVAIARPQVGIERLPTRRVSNEPRESMNCKSCRKRKIKCNRLRPACEACQVFQCPCIYDAVPKKRGPKTDVLEALLRRVDGLEAKLKEKNNGEVSPNADVDSREGSSGTAENEASKTQPNHDEPSQERPSKRLAVDTRAVPNSSENSTSTGAPPTPCARIQSPVAVQTDALLDTFFTRFHAKPYHILDESSVRQRMQLDQLPGYLSSAISAVAARYTPHPSGYQSAVKLSEDYATQAREGISIDDPSIDGLQACLLLVTAFTAAGKGKKAYMLLTSAVGMAMALEIHREVDSQSRVTPVEREMRRRLFWTCYLLDRYMACGSKRPSLISDKTIMLRLPSWSPNLSSLPMEGEFFQAGSNLQYFQGSGKKSQGSSGMLIDISRILGVTNRYLAAGGVKGDSHFPWHSLSNLSKIRQDLDVWASGTDDVFSSLDVLFGQVDSTILVLSKLIYHLIHCLIYRPFLPIDLAELAGTGQHQSWQIEATNMCFLHANAIAELIELGKQTNTIEWPAFVGYCICTAGTVHIHGAHYSKQGASSEMNVFSSSADFLSREMQQLSELRYAWASVQHQRETLQGIYNAHAELVKSQVGNAMRYTPGFHLEDFFDRYANIGGPGGQTFHFDAANLSLSDIIVDFTADTYSGHDLYAPRVIEASERPNLKRKNTAPAAGRKRSDFQGVPKGSGMAASANRRHSVSQQHGNMMSQMSGRVFGSVSLQGGQQQPMMDDPTANASSVTAATGFGLSPNTVAATGQSMTIGGQPYTPPYSYTPGSVGSNPNPQLMNEPNPAFDPMFAALPTNAFSSPAAWQTEDGGGQHKMNQPPPQNGGGGGAVATSPAQKSNSGGSTGTAPADEKDPFLSLLEQLAENEHRFNGVGSELDFFLTNNGSGG